jgi:hypothetical protein
MKLYQQTGWRCAHIAAPLSVDAELDLMMEA